MDKYFQFIFRHHFKALPLGVDGPTAGKQSADKSSGHFGDLGLWQETWLALCRLAIIINIDQLTD